MRNNKIKSTVVARIRIGLSGIKTVTSSDCMDLLGCTIDELVVHIKGQFTEGMSLDKLGLKGIHLDHRKPLSRFDLRDEKQRKKCFNYKNIQPLWAKDNKRKADYYIRNPEKFKIYESVDPRTLKIRLQEKLGENEMTFIWFFKNNLKKEKIKYQAFMAALNGFGILRPKVIKAVCDYLDLTGRKNILDFNKEYKITNSFDFWFYHRGRKCA